MLLIVMFLPKPVLGFHSEQGVLAPMLCGDTKYWCSVEYMSYTSAWHPRGIYQLSQYLACPWNICAKAHYSHVKAGYSHVKGALF